MKKLHFNVRIAFFFFFLQFLIFFRNFSLGNYDLFFFFCNHIALLLGFSFLFNRINFVKSLINVGFLMQLGWILDFLSNIFLGVHITGSTAYIFTYDFFNFFITLLTHFLTLSLALFFTYDKKTNNVCLFYSLTYLVLIYFLTLIFTNPINDINCVFNACNLGFFQFTYFTFFWIPIGFLVYVLPTHYFQKYLYYLSIK